MKENEKKESAMLLLMCFLAYAISYIGKYSYSTNINNVIATFGVSKAQAGYVTSGFFFCYGAGQLINGITCEKMNSRWTVSLALLISSVITLCMYFTKNIYLMTALWSVNGLVLSTLWCHCIKLLATIKEREYITRSVTVMSLTLPTGIVLAYGTSALFTYWGIWQFAYLFSVILLAVIGVCFFWATSFVKTTPIQEKEQKAEGKNRNLLQFFGLAAIPLFLICICTGLIRDGSSGWMPVLLAEVYQMPDYFSILITLGLPFVGVFTAVLSTALMYRVKNVMLCALLAGGVAVLTTGILILVLGKSVFWLIVLFMLLSLAAYIMGNTLTSILPLYYKENLKSGQAAGIIDAFIYLGSAVSSMAFGGIVEQLGWSGFILILFGCAGLLTLSAIAGWILLRKKPCRA